MCSSDVLILVRLWSIHYGHTVNVHVLDIIFRLVLTIQNITFLNNIGKSISCIRLIIDNVIRAKMLVSAYFET